MTAPANSAKNLRVWDLPTRAFHWALVICIVGAIVSIKMGETGWHFRFGYAILGLLLFRLVWGVVGPRYARFSSFPPRLIAAWKSLRGAPDSHAGHNPAGALSVYALLASCSFQVISGLFSNDGILWDGPLRKWVAGSTSDMITGLHLANRWLLIGLIALHVAAIIWYRAARGRRLTSAMISGLSDQAPAGSEPTRDDSAIRLRAAVVLAASAAAVWWLVR